MERVGHEPSNHGAGRQALFTGKCRPFAEGNEALSVLTHLRNVLRLANPTPLGIGLRRRKGIMMAATSKRESPSE
jgi:hypothetical protein